MNMVSNPSLRADKATTPVSDKTGPNSTHPEDVVISPKVWAPDEAGWRVAVVWLPNVSLTSLYGTYEDYVAANYVVRTDARFGRRAFLPRIVSPCGRPQRGLVGATVSPDEAIDPDKPWDAIIVPALMDDGSISTPPADAPVYPEELKDWLRSRYEQGAIVAGVCTGAFVLAEAGLLDGHEATMHWFFEQSFAERFSRVEVHPKRSIVRSGPDGRLITGGASAYVADVNLHVIARFGGPGLTREVAKLFGKFWQDDPRDERVHAADRPRTEDSAIAVAQAWMRDHACVGASVAEAADHIHLTERTFARRFRKALGISPVDFLQSVRIDRARELLERSRLPIDEVAAKVGYAETAAFRRAFRRKTGMSPSDYRKQFKLPPKSPQAGPC